MESHSRIGIYLRKDRATVVCLASQGRERKVLDSFCVSADDQEQEKQQSLADQIAKQCSERRVKIAEACVALDCTLFMQHRIHSEFSDAKKIAATIRFDTEEALSTDVSDLAVTFRVVSSAEGGAELDVFTAERSVLTDILLSLQANGTDPLTVEPDVWLLAQYLMEASASRQEAGGSCLYALLSDRRGYLIGIAGTRVTMMRAFPVSPSQDHTDLLTREILLGSALTDSADAPQKLYVVDAAGGVNIPRLQMKMKVPVESYDLETATGISKTDGGPNVVDLAIAFGAALPQAEANRVNFRSDHMPHLGKKMRLHGAVRWCSIAVTILLLALGVYAQTWFLKHVKQPGEQLLKRFQLEYVVVMLDKSRLPKTIREGATNLESLARRIRQEKSGQWSDQASVSARLALVLQAVNSCTATTDLKIESIEIGLTRIAVNGNTSSPPNTEKVVTSMKAVGLKVDAQNATNLENRSTFRFTLEPTGQPAKAEADQAGAKTTGGKTK